MTNASNADATMAAITTIGSTRTNFPITPVTKSSGMKAMIVVSDEPSTGKAMLPAPSIEARSGVSPCRRRVWMLSAITMASSTMIPDTMISANRLMRLTVCPENCMKIRAPLNATGIPAATHSASRKFEEETERDHDQDEPRRGVLEQHVDPLLDIRGVVRPDRHLQPVRQGRLALLYVVAHHAGNGEGVLGRRLEHTHEHRRPTVEAAADRRLRESLAHRGDLPQTHQASGP